MAAALGSLGYYAHVVLGTTPEHYQRAVLSLLAVIPVLLVAATASIAKLRVVRRVHAEATVDWQVERERLLTRADHSDGSARNQEQLCYSTLKEFDTLLGIDFDYCTKIQQFLLQRPTQEAASQISTLFEKYLNNVLAHVAILFSGITGDNCAACVKILTTEPRSDELGRGISEAKEGSGYIFTMARDPTSHYEREQAYAPGKRVYPLNDNTAFYEIKYVTERNGLFWKNDLVSLGDTYRNSNARWREFYNATIVAALQPPTTRSVEQALGYLCIDNKKGRFDSRLCKPALECISSILYFSIRATITALDRVEEAARARLV